MASRKAFLLRVSPDLLKALQHWADEDFRSLNGQIEYLLADQLRRARRPVPTTGPGPDEEDASPPGTGS